MSKWAHVELPERVATVGGLSFVPLTPTLLESDYTAVMRDIPMLRAWSGQDWPTVDFTMAEDLLDLERHDREQRMGLALTYSVLIDDVVQGCIYVRPILDALATRGVTNVDASTLPVGDIVVRGWLHDRPAVDLIRASTWWLQRPPIATGRLWWQTNTQCPDQLDACDALGLTEALSFDGVGNTWVLRSRPTA